MVVVLKDSPGIVTNPHTRKQWWQRAWPKGKQVELDEDGEVEVSAFWRIQQLRSLTSREYLDLNSGP